MKMNPYYWVIATITLAVMLVVAMWEPLRPFEKPGLLVLATPPMPPIQIPGSRRYYLDVFGVGFFAFVISRAYIIKGSTAGQSVMFGALYGYIYLVCGVDGIVLPMIVVGAIILKHCNLREEVVASVTFLAPGSRFFPEKFH